MIIEGDGFNVFGEIVFVGGGFSWYSNFWESHDICRLSLIYVFAVFVANLNNIWEFYRQLNVCSSWLIFSLKS